MRDDEGRRAKDEVRLLMKLPPFVTCAIERRLNRFVVQVRHRGKPRPAHINNTGRLLELLVEGREAACIPWNRKTSFRLFAVREEAGWALLDTQFQMRAFERSVEKGWIGWLRGYRLVRRNPRLGEAVLDYLLRRKQGNGELYLETKSAVMRQGTYAAYPDCPTLRGQRHVRVLTEHAARGGKGAICFVAALPGVTAFQPSVAGDPVVTALIRESRDAGVEVRAVAMHFDGNGILLDSANLPVLFP